jgi:signal peptidase II
MLLQRKKIAWKERLIPLILAPGIIVIDQIAKIFVMRLIPSGGMVPVIGDFFRLINVQNTALSFSIGRTLPLATQKLIFPLVQLAVMVLILLYYLFTRDELTRFQRWCAAALIGGGLGNYVDRIFRPAGVVDFLDFKFYGIFGWERWPTFNLADTTLVVCIILILISFLIPTKART